MQPQKRLFPDYPSDDYRQLRNNDLQRAIDEFFTHGTGPRAKFQADWSRDCKFRSMCEEPLPDLADVFDPSRPPTLRLSHEVRPVGIPARHAGVDV